MHTLGVRVFSETLQLQALGIFSTSPPLPSEKEREKARGEGREGREKDFGRQESWFQSRHIPYGGLGGSSLTCMVACRSPSKKSSSNCIVRTAAMKEGGSQQKERVAIATEVNEREREKEKEEEQKRE